VEKYPLDVILPSTRLRAAIAQLAGRALHVVYADFDTLSLLAKRYGMSSTGRSLARRGTAEVPPLDN